MRALLHSSRARTGFTLIETLIVLMIAGVLMVSATSLLVNFTILRAKPVEAFEFADHVNGLSDFLNAAVNGDAMPPAYQGTTEEGTAALTVRLDRFPEQSRFRAPRVEFDLPGRHPLCAGTETYSAVVRAQLVFMDPGGLFLHWYVESSDPRNPDGKFYHRRLSPWVSGMRYAYYDAELELWEIETKLLEDPTQADTYRLPNALLIELRESTETEPITIPIYLPGTQTIGNA